MNIIQLPLGEVHPYKNNPRKNDGAVDAVAESIRQYGFLVPLVISADHEIITGHTRFKAAKKLGLSSVPCVIADELTEEQIKAFRLVDNKVGELAEWDVDLLPLELADIAQDLSPFGFETISEDEFGEEFTLDSGEKKPYQQISLTLHDKQAELILACIDYVHTHGEVKETFGNENHKGNGVYEVVRQWAEQKKLDPITKEVRKNNGEKPQYFVEGSHEGILDRETYEKVLAERARRAAAYKPRSGSYERNRFPFSGKIHCGKCGKSFTRKVLNGNTPYEKRGWLCRTFNQKGKAHCDAKQIPEEILKRVSAEAMGLPEFDEAAFAAKVEEIQVPENGVLVFVFYDGHTVTKTWDNPSRRHSWNPENRQRARELALRQAAERRLAKCQQ